MRREYKERFGVDVRILFFCLAVECPLDALNTQPTNDLAEVCAQMPDDEAEGDASTRVEKMNPKEKVAFYCGALAKKYRAEEPERLAVCLKTLKQYLSNAKEHPLDSKYLRIR